MASGNTEDVMDEEPPVVEVELLLKNGARYTGGLDKNGKYAGPGKIVFPSGAKWSGTWVKGLLHSYGSKNKKVQCIKQGANGDILSGYFFQGELVGPGRQALILGQCMSEILTLACGMVWGDLNSAMAMFITEIGTWAKGMGLGGWTTEMVHSTKGGSQMIYEMDSESRERVK